MFSSDWLSLSLPFDLVMFTSTSCFILKSVISGMCEFDFDLSLLSYFPCPSMSASSLALTSVFVSASLSAQFSLSCLFPSYFWFWISALALFLVYNTGPDYSCLPTSCISVLIFWSHNYASYGISYYTIIYSQFSSCYVCDSVIKNEKGAIMNSVFKINKYICKYQWKCAFGDNAKLKAL